MNKVSPDINTDFWLRNWQEGKIAFHRDTVSPHLVTYFETIKPQSGETIFVPLCGKSNDMLWLMKQGFHVVGVELSPLACDAFFKENALPFKRKIEGEFIHYQGEHIDIFCGDFFNFTPSFEIKTIYDHAGLTALPSLLQLNYLKHLKRIISPQANVLLTVCEFNAEMQGPPFHADMEQVSAEFGDDFHIHCLARNLLTDPPQRFINKGFSRGAICYYHLTNIS